MKPIPAEILSALERHFHKVIRERAGDLLRELPELQLPRIDATTSRSEKQPTWFPVPGMCGGFAYWLDCSGEQPKLISNSWCRVVVGSGQCHEIDVQGSKLVAEGFV